MLQQTSTKLVQKRDKKHNNVEALLIKHSTIKTSFVTSTDKKCNPLKCKKGERKQHILSLKCPSSSSKILGSSSSLSLLPLKLLHVKLQLFALQDVSAKIKNENQKSVLAATNNVPVVRSSNQREAHIENTYPSARPH